MQVLTMHLNGAFSITSYCICRNSGWSSGRGYQPGSEYHQFYIRNIEDTTYAGTGLPNLVVR
jgi:hypothetical protein